MTLTIAAVIISLFSGFCCALVNKSVHVQQEIIVPFLNRIHFPSSMGVLTQNEHHIIHTKVDIFNLRVITCFVASLIAVGLGFFFIALVYYEGDARITGYLMSILFAYTAANYNINTTAVNWIRIVENDLLARILHKKQEESKFNTLGEYLDDENKKMAANFFKEMNKVTDDFDAAAEECGFDPDKDYEETEESYNEFLEIMKKTQDVMREKYPNLDCFSVNIISKPPEPPEK